MATKKFDFSMMMAVGAAVILSGCNPAPAPDMDFDDPDFNRPKAYCTKNGKRVDDYKCKRGGSGFVWFYATRGFVPVGGKVNSSYGSYKPSAGTSYYSAPAKSVSRGGFGSSARGSVGS